MLPLLIAREHLALCHRWMPMAGGDPPSCRDATLTRWPILLTFEKLTGQLPIPRSNNCIVLFAFRDRISLICLPAQPVDATQALNLSAGVSNCKVSRGRSFS
jgi:hypothetical protein